MPPLPPTQKINTKFLCLKGKGRTLWWPRVSTGDFRELWSLRDLGDPSGFSELRILGAPGSRSSGFSELRLDLCHVHSRASQSVLLSQALPARRRGQILIKGRLPYKVFLDTANTGKDSLWKGAFRKVHP